MAAKSKQGEPGGRQRKQARQSTERAFTEKKEGSEQEQQQGGQRSLAQRETGQITSRSKDPFLLMRVLADDLDRMAESFGFGRSLSGSFGALTQGRQGVWSPQIEVSEREGQITVRADLPGLKKDDVRVEISDDVILLSGERKQESEEKGEGYFRSERSYGSFSRTIPLPEGAKATDAKATFNDGVLEITVPTAQEKQKQARTIQIQ